MKTPLRSYAPLYSGVNEGDGSNYFPSATWRNAGLRMVTRDTIVGSRSVLGLPAFNVQTRPIKKDAKLEGLTGMHGGQAWQRPQF